MKSYVQVLGTYTSDSTPSIVVHYDSQRYLFNCGEGTQRLLTEHKLRMGKMKNVFVTHMDWRYIGGIPGMILTMAGTGTNGFTFHGPPNITHFMATLRHFIQRPEFPVSTVEFLVESNEYKDENVTITAVRVKRDDDTREHKQEHIDKVVLNKQVVERIFGSDALVQENIKKAMRLEEKLGASPCVRDIKNIFVDKLPETYPDDSVVCYICQGHPIKGKFDNEKAKALKLPGGRIRSQLVNGESVTLEDGRVVHSLDVCSPPRPGKVIMILHVPNTHYLKSLVNSASLNKLADPTIDVSCIIHMTDDNDVLRHPIYCQWLKQFGDKTEHIVLAKEANKDIPMFISAANQQNNLHNLDPEIFPMMYHQTKAQFDASVESLKRSVPFAFEPGKLMLRYDVEPKSFLNHDEATPAEARFEHAHVGDPKLIPVVHDAPCRVCFLGTGSMMPSKYRNVSGIFVNMPGGAAIFDDGEGTYGQLARMFGPTGVIEALQDLKCIFVSHMHADHHLGTINLLLRWAFANQNNTGKLFLVSPERMRFFLEEYAQCQDLPLDRVRFVDARSVLFNKGRSNEVADLERELQVTRIYSFPVDHCSQAYGFAVAAFNKDPFTVVYSGDTRPCQPIVNCVQHIRREGFNGHVLLIHEATFNDELQKEAIARKHSTTSEALQVAERMAANEVLLTHFSQRYPKLHTGPLENVHQSQIPLGLACDGMVVKIGQIHKVDAVKEAIQAMYIEQEVD